MSDYVSEYVSGTTSEYVSELKAEEILGHNVLQIVFITVEMTQSKIYVICIIYIYICSTLRHKLVLGILHTPRENKKTEPQKLVLSMIFLSKVYKGWPLLRCMLQPSVQLTAEKTEGG